MEGLLKRWECGEKYILVSFFIDLGQSRGYAKTYKVVNNIVYMLSKKFYTIFSLLFIVLFIGSMWYSGNTESKVFKEKWMSSDKTDAISVMEDTLSDSRVVVANYLYLAAKIIATIYWIFIVVLAIQLHKLKLASMVDVIIIIILAPLAVFFYFVTLMGKLKKAENQA